MPAVPSTVSDAKRPAPAHALVVGGTGMLRDFCLALSLRGMVVSVIAQKPERLVALQDEAARHGGVIHPLPVDYGHAVQLQSRIESARRAWGAISLAVCWVHGDAPQALPTIARCLEAQGEGDGADAHTTITTTTQTGHRPLPPPRLFHLIGSMDTRPAVRAAIERFTKEHPGIAWRRVLLGFKMTGQGQSGRQSGGAIGAGGSRWLTHEEIWQGTLAAIDNDWVESVIGVVTPWEKRPG